MTKIFDFLYRTESETPFFGYKTNAYLLLHEDGNILIYNYSKLGRYIEKIEELGGIKYHYLSHYHEYASNVGELNKKLGFKTYLSKLDSKLISVPEGLLDATTLDKDLVELHENFFAIFTPGHTEGSYSFVYKRAGETLLFTGDTLFVGKDDTLDITKTYSSNVSLMLRSIRKLGDQVLPSFIFPSGSLGSKQHIEIKDKKDWENQLSPLFAKSCER